MKKSILYLLVIAAIVMIPITILLRSYLTRLDKLAGDFERKFPYKFSDITSFDLGYNSYYIAGNFGYNLYLANHTIAPQLLKIDNMLSDTQTVMINCNPGIENTFASYELIIDSPSFYICYGTQHKVFAGNCTDWIAHPTKIRSPFFIECIPLSNSSMIFKYISAKTNANSFRKEFTWRDSIENDRILQKQVDGKFCTSGSLEYNKQLNVLTYIYAYRNQIIVMDTNLNLIKTIKTIDHIDSAKFEVSKINSNGKSVITKPTILVNPKCATYKKYLLVHSKIMGKHEDDRKFERSTIIDIYDIENGSYVYSISLPNYNKINISQLKVVDGYVYTMLDKYLQKYTVKLPE